MILDEGDKCICQTDGWFPCFGDGPFLALKAGDRLTVSDIRNIAGMRFLSFDETPDGHFYMATAFKPLRSLN